MKEIFVFGSNLAGCHEGGAAKDAYKKHGARWGMGSGHYGCSYAIPTLDQKLTAMPLSEIEAFVTSFLIYAAAHPEWDFKVTRIGCGIAGFTDAEIAPMFHNATGNVLFDEAWKPFIPHSECFIYWGTF